MIEERTVESDVFGAVSSTSPLKIASNVSVTPSTVSISSKRGNKSKKKVSFHYYYRELRANSTI